MLESLGTFPKNFNKIALRACCFILAALCAMAIYAFLYEILLSDRKFGFLFDLTFILTAVFSMAIFFILPGAAAYFLLGLYIQPIIFKRLVLMGGCAIVNLLCFVFVFDQKLAVPNTLENVGFYLLGILGYTLAVFFDVRFLEAAYNYQTNNKSLLTEDIKDIDQKVLKISARIKPSTKNILFILLSSLIAIALTLIPYLLIPYLMDDNLSGLPFFGSFFEKAFLFKLVFNLLFGVFMIALIEFYSLMAGILGLLIYFAASLRFRNDNKRMFLAAFVGGAVNFITLVNITGTEWWEKLLFRHYTDNAEYSSFTKLLLTFFAFIAPYLLTSFFHLFFMKKYCPEFKDKELSNA